MKIHKYLLPTLKVHCWGGIGSQLGAYSLYSELKVKGERRIKLVLHSSGVTRRDDSDFKELFPKVDYSFVDDYRPKGPQKTQAAASLRNLRYWLSNALKDLLKGILNMTRLIIFSEVKASRDLLPWTVGVRCTYSNLIVSKAAVAEIDTSLRNWSAFKRGQSFSENQFQIICHYRLGDLLDLETKTHISPQNLSLLIRDNFRHSNVSNVLILTENPEFAKTNLIDLLNIEYSIHFSNPGVLAVLWLGTSASFFIGTNSKVSIWISLLRAHNLMNPKSTFLPQQMKHGVQRVWPDCINFVNFY